jgi:two-component system response regulator (stage 0 sporulation protein F)
MTHSHAPSPSSSRPAIVLVEDEPDILIILQRLLRYTASAYEIISVANPHEALDQIAGRSVALLITDYNMPGMNGLQLTATVKQQSPGTRVALITAYATPEMEQQARAAGADYYLTKPFDLDYLESVVQSSLA